MAEVVDVKHSNEAAEAATLENRILVIMCEGFRRPTCYYPPPRDSSPVESVSPLIMEKAVSSTYYCSEGQSKYSKCSLLWSSDRGQPCYWGRREGGD